MCVTQNSEFLCFFFWGGGGRGEMSLLGVGWVQLSSSQTLLSEDRSPRVLTTSLKEGRSLRLGAQQRHMSL